MKRALNITAPIERDYDWFHDNLCEADRDELMEISGITGAVIGDAIRGFASESFSTFTLIDVATEIPVAIYGCVARETEDQKALVGYPWMLSTGQLWKYPKEVFTLADAVVKDYAQYFSYLQVVASAKHPKSIPFLKRLGFRTDIPIDTKELKGECLIYYV